MREDFNFNYDVHEIVCGVLIIFCDMNRSACIDHFDLIRGDQIAMIEAFIICDILGN